MVEELSSSTANRRFVLRPNRSMSWRQTKRFFALVCTVTLTVACGFAIMGYWPILPFAGLELMALGLGFWLCAASGRAIEVIKVEDHRVSVEKGVHSPDCVWQAPRAWVQVRLRESNHAWYPSRLVLRSHGREVALGDFLVEDERTELAKKLKELLRDEPKPFVR